MSIVAIVGRPNVGKSSLFNSLTQTKLAIVSEELGVTRDRQVGILKHEQQSIHIIDTAGLCKAPSDHLQSHMNQQTEMAIATADLCLFVVDGQGTITDDDYAVLKKLRKSDVPFWLVVNKIDNPENMQFHESDYYSFIQDSIFPTSCTKKQGITDIKEALFQNNTEEMIEESDCTKIAFVGRPNAGKSTLINSLLKEDRLLVSSEAGTTRDSIVVPFIHRNRNYELIDTAGLRRKVKIKESLERYSVIRSLSAIERSHIVLYLIDRSVGVTDQDLTVINYIQKQKKSLILVHTKDDLSKESQYQWQVSQIRTQHLRMIPTLKVSSHQKMGFRNLLNEVYKMSHRIKKPLTTSMLTRILEDATASHQPPLVNGRRIKPRVAHPQGSPPPHVIIIRGKQMQSLPLSYRTYLKNYFTETLDLWGCSLDLVFRSDENPYSQK